MEISKGKLVFVLGSLGFLFVGWFVSLFLLVGAGFGALGMFFLLPVMNRWDGRRRWKKLIKLRLELEKLEKEVKVNG